MKKFFSILFAILSSVISYAQVGINAATTIDPSAALEIRSGPTPKGLLAPRMTTAEKVLIDSPADGLIVYDTTEKAFYFYNAAAASWMKVANEGLLLRKNYKLIKSAADLAPELALGVNKYLLHTDTYYEINGKIDLTTSIDLNGAYVSGLDMAEDILSFPGGVLFKGTTGGNISNLTLEGGTAFEITGPGRTTASSLFVFKIVVNGMTTKVGSISDFGIFSANIVQFVRNKNGITYSNIGTILLDRQVWLSSNEGTYETIIGTFDFIGKDDGFSIVTGSAVALDVSGNPTVGTAVLQGTVFSGSSTSGYIKGYTIGAYPGYKFSTSWDVICPGIQNETDDDAVGEFSFDYGVGTGASTPFNNTTPSNIVKVLGTSVSENLFRFSTGNQSNKLIYSGRAKKYFRIIGSISFQAPKINTYIIYIAKNTVVISKYKVYGRAAADNDIVVVPLAALVELSPGDYIEVYAQRFTNTNPTNDFILTPTMTMVIK